MILKVYLAIFWHCIFWNFFFIRGFEFSYESPNHPHTHTPLKLDLGASISLLIPPYSQLLIPCFLSRIKVPQLFLLLTSQSALSSCLYCSLFIPLHSRRVKVLHPWVVFGIYFVLVHSCFHQTCPPFNFTSSYIPEQSFLRVSLVVHCVVGSPLCC